jgi:cytochrome c
LSPTKADEFVNVAKSNENNSRFVKFTEKGSYFSFKNLDLSGINSLNLELNPGNINGKVEVRIGGTDGLLIGESKLLDKTQMPNGEDWFMVTIPIEKVEGPSDVYFILKTESGISIWSTFNLYSIQFNK